MAYLYAQLHNHALHIRQDPTRASSNSLVQTNEIASIFVLMGYSTHGIFPAHLFGLAWNEQEPLPLTIPHIRIRYAIYLPTQAEQNTEKSFISLSLVWGGWNMRQ